jgi:hypothetical protein
LLETFARLRATDPARADAIVSRARAYAAELEALGVRDPWDLEVGHVPWTTAMRFALRLAIELPFAIVGAILGWIPYRLAGIVAGRVAREEDVLGTVKLLGGALFILVAWIVEAILAGMLTRPSIGAALFVLAPACGYVALRFSESVDLARASLRHLWLRRTSRSRVEQLARQRRELAEEVRLGLDPDALDSRK